MKMFLLAFGAQPIERAGRGKLVTAAQARAALGIILGADQRSRHPLLLPDVPGYVRFVAQAPAFWAENDGLVARPVCGTTLAAVLGDGFYGFTSY